MFWQGTGPVAPAALGLAVVVLAAVAARALSRWAAWAPAGPVALVAMAPVLPHVPLFLSLSLDDLLPLVGLALLVWREPAPRLTRDRVLRWVLIAAAVATAARIASAVANGGTLEGTAAMLAQAVARPLVLVAIVSYVAASTPDGLRNRVIAVSVAAVGTFEAAFGLLGFLVPLPGGAGIEAARKLTSIYGVCPGRVTGSLGLSANHLGAVLVVSVLITLGLAATSSGWRRWAWAGAAAIQAAGLMLTFTRSSILLGVLLAIGFLVYQRKFAVLVGVTTMTAGVLALAFAVSCTSASPGSIGGRFSDGNDRLALWYAAGRIMVDHPVFGVGLDRMNDVVKENPDRYRETPFGPATSSAHNTILLAAAETGVVGGLGTLGVNVGIAAIAVSAARRAWRQRSQEGALLLGMIVAVLGFLAQGMVNNLFSVPATSVLLALLVGAIAGTRGAATPTTEVT